MRRTDCEGEPLEFVILLGSAAAAAWPVTVCAQQAAMPVIGVVHPAHLKQRQELPARA